MNVAIVTQQLCDEMAAIIKQIDGIDVVIYRRENGYYIPEDTLTAEQMTAVRHFICGFVAGFFRDINQVEAFMESEYKGLCGDDELSRS